MIGARLTSEVWISALRKRLDSHAIPIVIAKKGDKQAGAILIRVFDLCGSSKIFVQAPSDDCERRWLELTTGLDDEIEEVLNRQKRYDDDLWVLEVEHLNGIYFFDEFLSSN